MPETGSTTNPPAQQNRNALTPEEQSYLQQKNYGQYIHAAQQPGQYNPDYVGRLTASLEKRSTFIGQERTSVGRYVTSFGTGPQATNNPKFQEAYAKMQDLEKEYQLGMKLLSNLEGARHSVGARLPGPPPPPAQSAQIGEIRDASGNVKGVIERYSSGRETTTVTYSPNRSQILAVQTPKEYHDISNNRVLTLNPTYEMRLYEKPLAAPQNVGKVGSMVDTINQNFGTQVLVAAKKGDEYTVGFNPNINVPAGIRSAAEKQLIASQFTKKGDVYSFYAPQERQAPRTEKATLKPDKAAFSAPWDYALGNTMTPLAAPPSMKITVIETVNTIPKNAEELTKQLQKEYAGTFANKQGDIYKAGSQGEIAFKSTSLRDFFRTSFAYEYGQKPISSLEKSVGLNIKLPVVGEVGPISNAAGLILGIPETLFKAPAAAGVVAGAMYRTSRTITPEERASIAGDVYAVYPQFTNLPYAVAFGVGNYLEAGLGSTANTAIGGTAKSVPKNVERLLSVREGVGGFIYRTYGYGKMSFESVIGPGAPGYEVAAQQLAGEFARQAGRGIINIATPILEVNAKGVATSAFFGVIQTAAEFTGAAGNEFLTGSIPQAKTGGPAAAAFKTGSMERQERYNKALSGPMSFLESYPLKGKGGDSYTQEARGLIKGNIMGPPALGITLFESGIALTNAPGLAFEGFGNTQAGQKLAASFNAGAKALGTPEAQGRIEVAAAGGYGVGVIFGAAEQAKPMFNSQTGAVGKMAAKWTSEGRMIWTDTTRLPVNVLEGLDYAYFLGGAKQGALTGLSVSPLGMERPLNFKIAAAATDLGLNPMASPKQAVRQFQKQTAKTEFGVSYPLARQTAQVKNITTRPVSPQLQKMIQRSISKDFSNSFIERPAPNTSLQGGMTMQALVREAPASSLKQDIGLSATSVLRLSAAELRAQKIQEGINSRYETAQMLRQSQAVRVGQTPRQIERVIAPQGERLAEFVGVGVSPRINVSISELQGQTVKERLPFTLPAISFESEKNMGFRMPRPPKIGKMRRGVYAPSLIGVSLRLPAIRTRGSFTGFEIRGLQGIRRKRGRR